MNLPQSTGIITRDKAIKRIMRALCQPLVLLSLPEREEAVRLAKDQNITASELLEFMIDRAKNI